MINNDRIVPIQKMDLLSMFGTLLGLFGVMEHSDVYSVLAAKNVNGDFTVTEAPESLLLANQPVRSLNFGADVSNGMVIFVPDHHYQGFSIDGTAVETTGDVVNPDGVTLYSATLNSGTVTIHAVTPMASNAAEANIGTGEANIGTGEATISTGSGNNGSN